MSPRHREVDDQDVVEIANAILTRWRLVPVEQERCPNHLRGIVCTRDRGHTGSHKGEGRVGELVMW